MRTMTTEFRLQKLTTRLVQYFFCGSGSKSNRWLYNRWVNAIGVQQVARHIPDYGVFKTSTLVPPRARPSDEEATKRRRDYG